MNETMVPAIGIERLSHGYRGKEVLHDLNLTVPAGEIFGFLGHNEAGKTTTMNILTTLVKPASGTVTLLGEDAFADSVRARSVLGYLPENVNFYDNLTTLENLHYLARLSGLRDPKPRILQTLDYLDFTAHIDERVGSFSKGMRQRVGLAQAILHEPKILFLDEPTSGLDPSGVKQVRGLVLKLNRERGITIFMNAPALRSIPDVYVHRRAQRRSARLP